MCDDTVAITMCKLDWECLECMSLWHVVLNPMLELCSGKISSTNTLELVISERSRQQIAQLSVPLCVYVVFIASQASHLLF